MKFTIERLLFYVKKFKFSNKQYFMTKTLSVCDFMTRSQDFYENVMTKFDSKTNIRSTITMYVLQCLDYGTNHQYNSC